jgi:uncharacterized membrane protein YedE/YeeE
MNAPRNFLFTTVWWILAGLAVFGSLSALGDEGTKPAQAAQAMPLVRQVRWSPYAVGGGIGILAILTFLVSNEAIGVSGAFARTAGMIERLFRGDKVRDKDYYRKLPPTVNWEWMFVVGLMIGAFVSARLSGDFEVVLVPERWQAAAGDSGLLRWAVAFVGGVCMGFGARWARGCTSGHGISGTLQLAVSSWIATAALFLGGIATAMTLYHCVL